MAKTVLITLTTDLPYIGPFDIYTDADGYTTPIHTGIAKALLLSGFVSNIVPDTANQIRLLSTHAYCNNFLTKPIIDPSTTTTTTTTEADPCSGCPPYGTFSHVECLNGDTYNVYHDGCCGYYYEFSFPGCA